MIPLTKIKGKEFDVLRKILGPPGDLTLLGYERADDSAASLLSVNSGWMAESLTDPSSAKVQLIEQSAVTKALMDQVVRFGVDGNIYFVKPGGIAPPLALPRLWQIRGKQVKAFAEYPNRVTFNRPTNTVSAAGGVTASRAATSPSGVPCRYSPASGAEKSVSDKIVSGTAYMVHVPSFFSSSLVDVDARCDAVIAALPGGEPSLTLHVDWIGRHEDAEIKILASREE
jgi:hypothetical protein